MSVNTYKISLYIDLAFCLVVLPLVLSIIPIEKMFASSTIFTVVLIIFLYAVYFLYRKVRVPSLLMKKKYLQAFLFIGILLVLTSLLAHFPLTDDFIMRLPEGEVPRISAHRAQRVWFLFLVVSGFSLSIDLTFELFRQVIARKEVEEARDKAELSLYKAQINPHFFMNMLNNIHALVDIDPQRAKKVIIELSKLMRHTLYDAENQRVSLESEIAFVSNYISIMRMRYPEDIVCINMELPEHPSPETRIPPLLFMPLLENAFKHGVSYVNDTAIDVKINEYEDNVSFFCRNTKPPASGSCSKGGLGLDNVRRRLNLLYGSDSYLTINDEIDSYSVSLTIPKI